MAHWTEIIQQIDQKYPFLSTLQLALDSEAVPDTLPDLLKISIASASGMAGDSPTKRVAIALPRLYTSSALIAIGTTLVSMQANFTQRIASLPPLIPGTKVKIDGKYIALFEQETE